MHDNRRTRLVLSVLLIVAITLITLDFKDGGASPARGLGADIFNQLEGLFCVFAGLVEISKLTVRAGDA